MTIRRGSLQTPKGQQDHGGVEATVPVALGRARLQMVWVLSRQFGLHRFDPVGSPSE
jgi:hypothetical protein